jgi:hypothetical protein
MGCFSYICQKTGEPILSSSFDGDAVYLFLLKEGKVIEYMYGNYDSYGAVFSNEKDPNDTSLTSTTSFNWKMDWSEAVDLHFDKNKSNGIAAILAPYWKEGDPFPIERSEDDPNQGWGSYEGEYDEATDSYIEGEWVAHSNLPPDKIKEIQATVLNPFHKVL